MSRELQDAIDLIEDPTRWTTGVAARDADGNEVALDDSTAVCWCGWGAMCRTKVSDVIKERVVTYCRKNFKWGVVTTNEGPDGHVRVLEAMRAVQGGWESGESYGY